MLEGLNLKEQMAIELRYLGNSYEEISQRLEVPVETAREWFKDRGKLHDSYIEYARNTDYKLQATREKNVAEKAENIITITTNVIRLYAKKLSLPNAESEITVADFVAAWKIQRIMQGLPTDVRTQNNTGFNQEQLDAEAAKIRVILNAGKDDQDDEPEMSQDEINKQLNL